MVEIVGLAVKIGIGPIEEMLTGVLTKSKIEMFPKNNVTTRGIHIEVFIVEELMAKKLA